MNWELLFINIFSKLVLEGTPDVIRALQADAVDGILKARATANPWDDILADLWGALVGVQVPKEEKVK